VDSVSLLQLYTEQSSVGAMKIMFERAIKRQPAIREYQGCTSETLSDHIRSSVVR
jgi:hypothetical protein